MTYRTTVAGISFQPQNHSSPNTGNLITYRRVGFRHHAGHQRSNPWFTHWVKETWISNSCPQVGNFHLRGSDEAPTAYGGLVAWDHFLQHCGVYDRVAKDYPLPRTSPNATPVIDILKAFSLNTLSGGTRFAHCRRLQDDGAFAKITGMKKERLCGEDAFRRLSENLEPAQVEKWFASAEQIIHHAIPTQLRG